MRDGTKEARCVCVCVWKEEKRTKHTKITKKATKKREGAIYYDRLFFHSRIPLDDRWD